MKFIQKHSYKHTHTHNILYFNKLIKLLDLSKTQTPKNNKIS